MTMSNASPGGVSRFVAETGRALQRYVRRLVGSPAAAEDIMQEAYVRTYQQGERVEQPKAFLFVTARNLAHNARRHQQVAATELVGDLDATGVYSDEGRSPGEGLIAVGEARRLRQAVGRQSPPCPPDLTKKVFQACSSPHYRNTGGMP